VIKVTPLPVPPIGKRHAAGFVDYADGTGGIAAWTESVYPPSPRGEALRTLRQARGFYLGDFARRLGLRTVELCDVERGRMTLSEEDWELVERMLKDERPGV